MHGCVHKGSEYYSVSLAGLKQFSLGAVLVPCTSIICNLIGSARRQWSLCVSIAVHKPVRLHMFFAYVHIYIYISFIHSPTFGMWQRNDLLPLV